MRFPFVDSSPILRFAQAIAKFRLENTRAYNALQNIIIAADNDEDPDRKFQNVCEHIERVFGPGTAPNRPQERAKTRPYVTVLMLPWTQERGHLEYLCCESADDADRTAGMRVDDLLALCGGDDWTVSRWGKAWLRTNLAIRCEQDPFVALGHVFNDPRFQHLIPVNHSSLNQIADFLAGFV